MRVVSTDVVNKLWGKTWPVTFTPQVEVWYLDIVKGGYSSKHCHRRKNNEFFVVSGRLLVYVYENKEEEQHETRLLLGGQKFAVPIDRWHRFEAVTPVQCIETYWPEMELLLTDIERVDVGGVKLIA